MGIVKRVACPSWVHGALETGRRAWIAFLRTAGIKVVRTAIVGSFVVHQIFLEEFSGLALYAVNRMVLMTRFEIWVVFCEPTNLSKA